MKTQNPEKPQSQAQKIVWYLYSVSSNLHEAIQSFDPKLWTERSSVDSIDKEKQQAKRNMYEVHEEIKDAIYVRRSDFHFVI
jgi:hypothetical protein